MDTLNADNKKHAATFDALAAGRCSDPFAVLGPHQVRGQCIVRTFQPYAEHVDLVDIDGSILAPMQRVHDSGAFIAAIPARGQRYRLRCSGTGGDYEIEDPYRFGPSLPNSDERRQQLGAHPCTVDQVDGTRFAVWAPNASRVSVIGEFNGWDGRIHVMRRHAGSGIWEMFLPHVGPGAMYKFELTDGNGHLLPLKADPYARRLEAPPGAASIVFASDYRWQDERWMADREPRLRLDRPVSIYEVHLGSWRESRSNPDQRPGYRELATELVGYARDMGFTHIEFLPVSEHPFDGSWGYQPIGMYAPTARFGDPDEFRYLVDQCHAAGIGVIVDWVAAHFPRDDHGLRNFDGTPLYEHADPRRAEQLDWGTLIFDYGRPEVVDYLVGSALTWVDDFHVDGLRVDAVASMLYLDYSREGADWLPNEDGSNENRDAVAFLRQLNEAVHLHGAMTFAEESTTWPGVSRPVYSGGLGFTYKWNLGWMHDTLAYMQEDPLFRKHHHDRMTFGLMYAFNENFVLPLSHDEVVHGKRSLIGRMTGDEWQRFANYRAYLAFMFCHPGKKLLFMGAELAQEREWNHDGVLDWQLLEQSAHNGIRELVRDLNRLYSETPALYELDFSDSGFEWLSCDDRDRSVYAWLRRAHDGTFVVCVFNFTPVVRDAYRLPVPAAGAYQEIFNSDAAKYHGSGVENAGGAVAKTLADQGNVAALELTLPPLAALVLRLDSPSSG